MYFVEESATSRRSKVSADTVTLLLTHRKAMIVVDQPGLTIVRLVPGFVQ